MISEGEIVTYREICQCENISVISLFYQAYAYGVTNMTNYSEIYLVISLANNNSRIA